jgi:hypothetical protein
MLFHLLFASSPVRSAIAYERTYLTFNPELLFLFKGHKMNVIRVDHLSDVFQGKYPDRQELWQLVGGPTHTHRL